MTNICALLEGQNIEKLLSCMNYMLKKREKKEKKSSYKKMLILMLLLLFLFFIMKLNGLHFKT